MDYVARVQEAALTVCRVFQGAVVRHNHNQVFMLHRDISTMRTSSWEGTDNALLAILEHWGERPESDSDKRKDELLSKLGVASARLRLKELYHITDLGAVAMQHGTRMQDPLSPTLWVDGVELEERMMQLLKATWRLNAKKRSSALGEWTSLEEYVLKNFGPGMEPQERLEAIYCHLLHTAASVIQGGYQCYFHRSRLSCKKAEAKAALDIHFQKEGTMAAAMVIQTVFRGHLGRRDAAETSRQRAAWLLQCVARGYQQRLQGAILRQNMRAAKGLLIRLFLGLSHRRAFYGYMVKRKELAGQTLASAFHGAVHRLRCRRWKARKEYEIYCVSVCQQYSRKWISHKCKQWKQYESNSRECIGRFVLGYRDRKRLGTWQKFVYPNVVRLQRAFQRYVLKRRRNNRVAIRLQDAQRVSTLCHNDYGPLFKRPRPAQFSKISWRSNHLEFLLRTLQKMESDGRDGAEEQEALELQYLFQGYARPRLHVYHPTRLLALTQKSAQKDVDMGHSRHLCPPVRTAPCRPVRPLTLSPSSLSPAKDPDLEYDHLPLPHNVRPSAVVPTVVDTHAADDHDGSRAPTPSTLHPILGMIIGMREHHSSQEDLTKTHPMLNKTCVVTSVERLRMWNADAVQSLPHDISYAQKCVAEAMTATEARNLFVSHRKDRSWWRGVTLYTHGLVLSTQGNDIEGLRKWRQALKLISHTPNEYAICARIAIADALLRIQEPDHAFTYIHTAAADALTIHHDELSAMATLVLAQVQRASIRERTSATATWERAYRMATMTLGPTHPITKHIYASPVAAVMATVIRGMSAPPLGRMHRDKQRL